MERILRAEGDWQDAVALALRRVPRPIRVDPRVVPRLQPNRPGDDPLPPSGRSGLPPPRRAATLLLLYPRSLSDPTTDATRELVVPLTVRHAGLRAHAGEVSLPGGAIDPSDASPADAALREAWEELRIPPAEVRILG